jgi:hypothetical protein
MTEPATSVAIDFPVLVRDDRHSVKEARFVIRKKGAARGKQIASIKVDEARAGLATLSRHDLRVPAGAQLSAGHRLRNLPG